MCVRTTVLTGRASPKRPRSPTWPSSRGTPGRGRSPWAGPSGSSAGASSASPATATPATTPRSEPARPAVRLAPDVLLVQAPDGSGRLLDLGGSFYALDPIAVELLWDVARRGRPETVRAAARRYGVPEQRVAADLDELLAVLPPGVGTEEVTSGGGRGDRLPGAPPLLPSPRGPPPTRGCG